jgi:hypothetical protein
LDDPGISATRAFRRPVLGAPSESMKCGWMISGPESVIVISPVMGMLESGLGDKRGLGGEKAEKE